MFTETSTHSQDQIPNMTVAAHQLPPRTQLLDSEDMAQLHKQYDFHKNQEGLAKGTTATIAQPDRPSSSSCRREMLSISPEIWKQQGILDP